MALPPLIRPHVYAHPTLDTAVWFLHLRWLAVAGQLVTMAVVAWAMRIELPVARLLMLIGITAATNTGYWLWLSRLHRLGLERNERLPTDQVVSILILVDILVLTGMLYLSAGIANPFALFYFVNIAVAGAIITPSWAWGIWATTVAGVTLLAMHAIPIAELSGSSLVAAATGDGESVWNIPKLGYLVSFATCSGVITYFITILTGELRTREQALKEAEEARLRARQLEGLATLAGGAAHELASPLSTIAVVAKELGRSLDKFDVPNSVTQDVLLIRSELDRCRQILDRMTSAAGEAAGERLQHISAQRLVDESLLGLRDPQRVSALVDQSLSEQTSLLPVQAVAQSIRNLLQNGLDASSAEDNIQLRVDAHELGWLITILDRGTGMTEEVLERIGEPFFTTKEPGRGMGLGLSLTQNVIRRLEGTLKFTSKLGEGTTAEILLPVKRS